MTLLIFRSCQHFNIQTIQRSLLSCFASKSLELSTASASHSLLPSQRGSIAPRAPSHLAALHHSSDIFRATASPLQLPAPPRIYPASWRRKKMLRSARSVELTPLLFALSASRVPMPSHFGVKGTKLANAERIIGLSRPSRKPSTDFGGARPRLWSWHHCSRCTNTVSGLCASETRRHPLQVIAARLLTTSKTLSSETKEPDAIGCREKISRKQ